MTQENERSLDVVHAAFFRHFKVRWIVQESPLYYRVEGCLLNQNPLSVNSVKFSFSRYTTYFISVAENRGFSEFEDELQTKVHLTLSRTFTLKKQRQRVIMHDLETRYASHGLVKIYNFF